MRGERDLDRLIRGMEPVLHPDTFVFATTTDDGIAAMPAVMRFQEAEGVTLIVTAGDARAAGLEGAFPSRMITLNIHSSLDAVGFMARIIARLAAEEMGVNPVAGYFHDHLFVPEGRVDDAMRVLSQMAAGG
ncbi:MAG: ACT domain-containing protein [Jannaschia sp.]